MKKIYGFDIDGTITLPGEIIEEKIGEALIKLSNIATVTFITGGSLENVERQIISQLKIDKIKSKVYIYTGSGSQLNILEKKEIKEIYSLKLDDEKQNKIIEKFKKISRISDKSITNHFVKRENLLSLTVVGLNESRVVKNNYDPNKSIRSMIINQLSEEFSDFRFSIGGSTSIDVTIEGVDKGYAVEDLLSRLNITPNEMIYFGDRFEENGNDHPVKRVITNCINVTSPEETLKYINSELTN